MESVGASGIGWAGAGGLQLPEGAGGSGGLPYGLAQWWKEHRGRDPFFLVPSREDVAELTLVLAVEEGALLGGPVAGTFDDLASLVLEGRGRRLGEVAREVAVRRAAAVVLAEPGSVLGRLGPSPAGLASLLEEMEESGMGTEEICRILTGWERGAAQPEVRRLAAELGAIYEGYTALCAARSWNGTASTLRAAALRVQAAAEAEAAAVKSGREQGTSGARAHGLKVWARPILCVGFLNFTPVQRGLLDALGRSASVTERPFPCGSAAGRAPFRLLLSAGRRGEMETVAAEVVELVRSGMAADDIALVARRAAPWRRVAEQVFSAYGIPLRVDAAFRFRETGLGSALLPALAAVLRGEGRGLVGLFQSRYRQRGPDTLEGGDLERWRAITSWPANPAACEVLRELFPEDMGLLQVCVGSDGAGASCLRPEGVVNLARSMVAVSARRLPPTHPTVAEDLRALQALETALAEMEDLDGDETGPAGGGGAGARTGASPLLDILADAALWPPARMRGAVTLRSATRLRLRPYRAVFVLGLVDQEFPAADRSPGLLPASLRRECNRLGGQVLFEEPAEGLDARLFEVAVSRGTEFVYLSQRVSDADGTALSPSPFLLSVDVVAGGLRPWRERTLADVVHPAQLSPSHREYLRACAALSLLPAAGEDASRVAAAVESVCPPPGPADERVIGALSARRTFAAGEIEAYARCPFAWFLQSQVGVRAAEEDAGPRDLGLLVHAAMARLYEELGKRRLLPLTPAACTEALARAERILSEVATAQSVAASPASHALLLAQARYRVREHLEREAGAGSVMVTEAVELQLPTHGVDVGDDLVVHGRVDRVDVSPSGDGFTVVDYKTGSFVPRKGWAEEGTLQVALYLLALSALWPDRRALGGGYLFLGRGSAKGLVMEVARPLVGEGAPWAVVPEEELRRELEECRSAALVAVRGMRAGKVRPDRTQPCPRFCALGHVCRSRRGPRWGWA